MRERAQVRACVVLKNVHALVTGGPPTMRRRQSQALKLTQRTLADIVENIVCACFALAARSLKAQNIDTRQ